MYRTLLVVVLVAFAGCALPVAPGNTSTDGVPTDGTPSLTDHTPSTTDGTPVSSPTPSSQSPDRSPSSGTPTPPAETPAATFVVDGEERATVTLEVADDGEERAQGLMDRESLARDHGMLFVFDAEESRRFWMKDTLIPLDMIFIDANRTVLNVEHASVQENATNDELRGYYSDGPAKYVIEVNRGFANRTGVDTGTRVVFHGEETLLTPEE